MFKFNKKLKSSEKKILYDGGFKIKTNFNNEYMNSYLKICKASEAISKYFIESYNESASKLLFLIALDNIDQIDYRKTDKVIMLKSSNEFCKIDADNKMSLRSLLKILSSYCGFEEETQKETSSSSTSKFEKDTSIAGGVTNCVGSVCSINKKLDGLFGHKASQKSSRTNFGTNHENNNGNRSQLSYLNLSCDNEMNDSYFKLGECESGLHKNSKNSSISDILVLNNKSNILINQISEINSCASDCSLNVRNNQLAKNSKKSMNSMRNSVSDDIFLDDSQQAQLNYVPLEVVQNQNVDAQKINREQSNNDVCTVQFKLSDKSTTSLPKFTQQSDNHNGQLVDYGRFDKIKTEALKSAFETNFNRLS